LSPTVGFTLILVCYLYNTLFIHCKNKNITWQFQTSINWAIPSLNFKFQISPNQSWLSQSSTFKFWFSENVSSIKYKWISSLHLLLYLRISLSFFIFIIDSHSHWYRLIVPSYWLIILRIIWLHKVTYGILLLCLF